VIASSGLATAAHAVGPAIECSMSRDRVGELNRLLVLDNIPVHALVPKRSLEEYFLSITEGGSEL